MLSTLAAVALGQMLSSGRILASGDDLAPNYAARMLSPYEGSEIAPKLLPLRRTMPVRVGVAADPAFVTDARLDAVRSACGRWARAVGGGLRFAFVQVRQIGDADVVFTFGRIPTGRTLRGRTVESFGWASVDLAVEDAEGVALPIAQIARVAAHEMGHALGIWGHSPDPGDIMSTEMRTTEVSLADANTFRLAYLPSDPRREREIAAE